MDSQTVTSYHLPNAWVESGSAWMQQLRCYRLHDPVDGQPRPDFDDYVELDGEEPDGRQYLRTYGPVSGPGFDAKLYVSIGRDHPPRWADFLRPHFEGLYLPQTQSIGATMVVRLNDSQQHFAFTFGTTGRHLLRDDAWTRAYGTRAALNIVFEEGADPMSVLAVRTKRRGPRTLRNEAQSSGATSLETFGVDLFRDVFGGFTGVPHDDELWGSRVTGGDALTFQSHQPFNELLQICRAVDAASRRDDYRQLAPWLGDVQPVSEPDEVSILQAEVVRMLREQDTEHLDVAPPEIIDWQKYRRVPSSRGPIPAE